MGRLKIPIRGKVFGRLLVLDDGKPREPGGKHLYHECRCECGKTTFVQSVNLRAGSTSSCGCLKREKLLADKRALIHGGAGTTEYNSWMNAKHACYRRAHQAYYRVGAVGIRVCPEWLDSFPTFLKDMGKRPSPYHRLMRKNLKENFSKDNCYWDLSPTRKKKNG